VTIGESVMTNSRESRRAAAASPRVLDLRSGGWVIVLAGVLTVGAAVAIVLSTRGSGGRWVGRQQAAGGPNGFDLAICRIPRDEIVRGGPPKDGIPAITDPRMLTAAEVDAITKNERGKYLVSDDRVIGVAIDGDARAYPLNILCWHEVVNDVVGGRPIAVTYCPLCDSAVVFDRRVDDETLEFGVSGLLYNSNALLYDRRPGGRGESLWSQLKLGAVTGPAAAANQTLTIVPSALVRWADWRRAHPDTGVLARDPAYGRRYRRSPYQSYFGDDRLRFPVRPLPSREERRYKTRVVALAIDGERVVVPMPEIARLPDHDGVREMTVGDARIRMRYDEATETVDFVEPDDAADLAPVYTFWFAWHAMHPDDAVWRVGGVGSPPSE
jgi:hypothetical protein